MTSEKYGRLGKNYVVHCSRDEDLKVALCGQLRGISESLETHMFMSARDVLAARTSEEFRDGRTYEDKRRFSMRFCVSCLDHPDLELLVLGEV